MEGNLSGFLDKGSRGTYLLGNQLHELTLTAMS